MAKGDKMTTTYRVSRFVGSPREPQWEVVADYPTYAEADAAARAIVKGGCDYTEPGFGLRAAFYGRGTSRNWAAMVEPIAAQESLP